MANRQVSILNSPAVGDVSVSGGLISITGITNAIKFGNIASFTRTPTAAGTLSEKTWDISALTVASKVYVLTISHDGTPRTYSFNAESGVTTEAEITAGLLARVLADSDAVVDDNTTAGTDLKFKLKSTELLGGDFTITITDLTAAANETVNVAFVAAAGTNAVLVADNDANQADISATKTYTTYVLEYKNETGHNNVSGNEVLHRTTAVIYAEDSFATFADFDQKFSAVGAGDALDGLIEGNQGLIVSDKQVVADWSLANANSAGTLAASLGASDLVLPISGLNVGDEIASFQIFGQVESAGNAVVIDADLRKNAAAAADPVDASIDTITRISVTADTKIDSTLGKKSLATVEVVAADTAYYILVSATTLASTDIQLLGAIIEINRK